jgi:hypothetical protein
MEAGQKLNEKQESNALLEAPFGQDFNKSRTF